MYTIHEHQVGYGQVGEGPDLGYDDLKVFVPKEFAHWHAISAHGPSRLKVRFHKPVEIVGILNGTCYRLRKQSPTQFFLNDWYLGCTDGPWSHTIPVTIPSGDYRLKVCDDNSFASCHSLWLFREANQALAFPDNTVIYTVDTYGPNHVFSSNFRRTAEYFKIPVIFRDEGEKWQGFYHHKIEMMMPCLREALLAGKKYTMILDSRDVIFVDPLDFILAKFNSVNRDKVIFNSDGLGAIWPHQKNWLLEAFQNVTGHFQAVPNAGVILAKIEVLLEAMEFCSVLRKEILSEKPRSGYLKRLFFESGSRYSEDDQMLYQIANLYRPELFQADIEKRIAVHLKRTPGNDWRNGHDFRDGGSVGRASILHAPDLARSHLRWTHWVNQVIGEQS